MRVASDESDSPAHTAAKVQAVLDPSCTAGPLQAVGVGCQALTAAGGQAVLDPSCTAAHSQAVVVGTRFDAVAFEAGAHAVMGSSDSICTAAHVMAGCSARAPLPLALESQAVDLEGHTAALDAKIGGGAGLETSKVEDAQAVDITDVEESLSSGSLSDSCESVSALS